VRALKQHGALLGSLAVFFLFGELRAAARILSRSVLEGARDRVYILRDGGRPIGFCALRRPQKRHSFAEAGARIIAPYFVKAGERGKGYGVALLLVVLAINPGIPVYALVEKGNAPSIKALEHAGFAHVGRVFENNVYVAQK